MSDNVKSNPLRLAVLATLATIIYIDSITPPDKAVTLDKLVEMRKISTRSATRHLNRLEDEGYIKRHYERRPDSPGIPMTIEVLKEIPDEVLATIPLADMYNPRSHARAMLWDIMTLFLDIAGPVTKPVDKLVEFARQVLR